MNINNPTPTLHLHMYLFIYPPTHPPTYLLTYDALSNPKLAPSWAKSLKLRNFWDSEHTPSF